MKLSLDEYLSESSPNAQAMHEMYDAATSAHRKAPAIAECARTAFASIVAKSSDDAEVGSFLQKINELKITPYRIAHAVIYLNYLKKHKNLDIDFADWLLDPHKNDNGCLAYLGLEQPRQLAKGETVAVGKEEKPPKPTRFYPISMDI